MGRAALVVGVTGMAGLNAAEALVRDGWQVAGLSRTRRYEIPGVQHITADVLDEQSIENAMRGIDISHVFFTTWSRQESEAENCAVNGAMLSNTLTALGRTTKLAHVVLVTGLKHYLGPFEAYATSPPETPFRETQGRLPSQNFYYDQEDLLLAEAERQAFTWSVHRPHTLIGYALGNAMNMGVTLAIYGSICRATGEPFVFPGSPEQLNGVTDITDARLARAPRGVVCDRPPRAEPGIQHRERRCLPVAPDVAAAGRGPRRRPSRVPRQADPAGWPDGSRRRGLGSPGLRARSRPLRGLGSRVVVAHRRRSRTPGRDVRRHVEEPGPWLP